MADVFVSYKSEDRQRVAPLVAALRRAELEIWWDQDIVPPANWRETIARELDAARLCLVVWTEGSVGPDGRYVREEAERAMARDAYLGVRLDRVLPPFGFGESQAADLSGWTGRRKSPHVGYLVELIRAKLAGVPAPPRPPPAGWLRRHARLAGAIAFAAAALALYLWLGRGSGVPTAPSTADFAGRTLATQPCTWVEVADVAASAGGDRLYLSGAAQSPAAMRIVLGRAAASAGVRLADIDISDVVTAQGALCDELEFLRSFKVEGRSRLRVDPPEMIQPRVARFRLQLDLRGLPPHRALFGLDPRDGLYALAGNSAEIRRQFGFRSGPNREWLQGIVDHEGWSALVLVTGRRPIDTRFIEQVSRRSDPGFVEEFARRARAGGWAFHLGAVDCDLSRPVGEPC